MQVVKHSSNSGQNLEGGVHPLAGGVDDGRHRQREEELEPVPAAVKYWSNTGQNKRLMVRCWRAQVSPASRAKLRGQIQAICGQKYGQT